jgi:hypothetical protein
MPTSRLLSRLVPEVCLTFALAACDSGGDEEATTDSILGQLSLPAGLNGTVANAALQVYGSFSDCDAGAASLRTAADDEDGRFSAGRLDPGNYFFLTYKDNNNDNSLTGVDFYGFSSGLGSPGHVESLQLSVTR